MIEAKRLNAAPSFPLTLLVQVCLLLKSMLDDDSDMWDMHLTAKETQRIAAQVCSRLLHMCV